MSHAIFQTAQIMPIKTIPSTQTLSSKISLLPPSTVPLYPLPSQAAAVKLCKPLLIKASSTSSSSSSGLVDRVGGTVPHLERCFQALPAVDSAAASLSSSPVMKKDYGAFGAVTLEKSKLDITQKQAKSSPEVWDFFFFKILVKLVHFCCYLTGNLVLVCMLMS